MESERQKRRHVEFDVNGNHHATLPNYSDLLERKRQEEKRYREVNGLSVIHENDDNDVSKTLPSILKHQPPANAYDYQYLREFESLERHPGEKIEKAIQTVPTSIVTNQTSSNNPLNNQLPKTSPAVSEHSLLNTTTTTITTTTSSVLPSLVSDVSTRVSPAEARRQAALKYREELRKQIEEKKRREELQRLREANENKRWERKVEEQRLRMLQEYYDEEERQRKKTDDLIKKQELAKQVTKPQSPIPARQQLPLSNGTLPHNPLSIVPPRSPSYVHVQFSKAPPLHRHTSSVRALEDRLRRTSISVAGGEFDKVLEQTSVKVPATMNGDERPANPTPPRTHEGVTDFSRK